MDDRQLVGRIRAGDAEAEREMYDAHVDRVYGLAFRMTGDEALARDFTQDAFVPTRSWTVTEARHHSARGCTR